MHTGGGGGGHIMYPLKQFKKFGHKNAIKHENRDLHLGRFSHNLKYVPKKNLQKNLMTLPGVSTNVPLR
jgi:hypothetical protein